MSENPEKHDPTAVMINAMEQLDNVTHALVIIAFENGDVEVRCENMPRWMIRGLLKEAIEGYEIYADEVEELEDEE